MHPLRPYRDKGPGLPDVLNWGCLIDNGVGLNKDGSLIAGWVHKGADLDSSPDARLNWVSDHVNNALSRLSGGWTIWCDAVRLPAPKYFDPADSRFPDPVSQLIEDERRAHFLSGDRHYETEYALLVQYTPPIKSKGMLVNLVYDDHGADPQSPGDIALAAFKRVLTEMEDALSGALDMQRMHDYSTTDRTGQVQRRSHLVNYLHFCLTGQEVHLNLPPGSFYLNSVIGGQDFYPGDTPLVGDTYVAVVAITGYPAASSPGLLSVLDTVPRPLRYSSRFIFVDATEARKQIIILERKWKQRLRGFWADVLKVPSPRVDEDALQMTEEANTALARSSSATVGTGYYTPVVVLTAPSPEEAIENARTVSREIMRLGFATRIETVNATEAFLGSLPGHAVPNVRRPPMHTDNLADLLPLTSVWTGRPTNPCPMYPRNAPAIMQAATTGAAPFWLNLHEEDVGHTLIFGPTGAGKSVLQQMLMAQGMRYPGMTNWAFDKGKSAYAMTRALGGRHYDIATDGDLQFCPLSVLTTDADLAWAEDYVAICFELQHEERPTPAEREQIHRAMARVRLAAVRSLSLFIAEVQSERVREAMRYYSMEGPLGHLLDAEHDGLVADRLITFEIEDLMGMGDTTCIPVLLYLFRRFEKQLRGQPAMLQLAEAWVMFGRPATREKIREWLKVLRKANCAVILDTQSLSDAAKSGLLDVLMEACPRKIFLPNPEATSGGTAGVSRADLLLPELRAERDPDRDHPHRDAQTALLRDWAVGMPAD